MLFMKLIVGLGNPGRKFEGTRHNVGFMALDVLVERIQSEKFKFPSNSAGRQNYNLKLKTDTWRESKKGQLEYIWLEVNGEEVEFIKPLTMMNNSGKAVAYVKKKHPERSLDNVYVVHDDLDISLGRYKIQFGKGPRQHKGLESLYERLGSKEFWHVRLGIENRSVSGGKMISGEPSFAKATEGKEYVLQRFTKNEQEVIDRTIQEVVGELHRRLSIG